MFRKTCSAFSIRAGVAPPPPEIGGRDELPRGSMTRGREQRTAPILSHGQTTSGQCGFNQAASPPPDPIKRHRARRERSHPKAMLTTQTSAVALDLLENKIDLKRLFGIVQKSRK